MKNLKYIVFYVLGGILISIGLVLFAMNVFKLSTSVDSGSKRFVAPGRIETMLDKEGKYILYYEYQSTFDGKIYSTADSNVSGLDVEVFQTNTKEKIELRATTMNSQYSINGRAGKSMFVFTVDRPMHITVEANYGENKGPDIILNLSPDILVTMFKGILGVLSYLVGFSFVGLIMVIVTVIMQVRARRRQK